MPENVREEGGRERESKKEGVHDIYTKRTKPEKTVVIMEHSSMSGIACFTSYLSFVSLLVLPFDLVLVESSRGRK